MRLMKNACEKACMIIRMITILLPLLGDVSGKKKK